jgi:hypothetical protein
MSSICKIRFSGFSLILTPKIVEVESESTQFKEDMKMQTKAFTEHVDRVGEQYSQIKKLKENIQENEVKRHIF